MATCFLLVLLIERGLFRLPSIPARYSLAAMRGQCTCGWLNAFDYRGVVGCSMDFRGGQP
jgi:hypothetical protein